MKKTLFAMAALALCGTAVADDHYVAAGQNYTLFDGDTLHVNNTVSVGDIYVELGADPVTLKYYGLNTITVSGTVFLYSSSPSINITGDEAAINHWVSELTSATGELKSVTLMTFTGPEVDVYMDTDDEFTFDGHFSGETVTLGNVSVEFIGSGYVETSDFYETMNVVLSENQIALIRQENGVIIAGKITGSPATPEPATATLSLLALAGLCARRRRH